MNLENLKKDSIIENTFELIITAEEIVSNDKRFTMDDLTLGNNYLPLEVYFKNTKGDVIKREREKYEQNISNQTLPRLACQIFEKQLLDLSQEERENFPICKYNQKSDMIKGIYSSDKDFDNYRHSREKLEYSCKNGQKFVIYTWSIFSTIIFAQECLKRFGKNGDKFVLRYREKREKVTKPNENETIVTEKSIKKSVGYKNPFSSMLIESKNLIFRGAPGTGKSYLAKEIATDIISNGCEKDFSKLSEEQKRQVEFVQFHPSYDYSDFVEGLRPKINSDGTMSFELKDGIFKAFVDRARINLENSQKPKDEIKREQYAQQSMSDFLSNLDLENNTFSTKYGNSFSIIDIKDGHIIIDIPGNQVVKRLSLDMNEIKSMLESEQEFKQVKDLNIFFKKINATQAYSYDFVIYNAIKQGAKDISNASVQIEEVKKYIFIIDEINRGEISKIFGELFFAIDPGYRGKTGEISTQYSNLHSNPDKKFYIPENVYIIGTMNDIDRSIDSFDFAMRRRFRFINLKANEQVNMLDTLGNEELKNEAIKRMSALNEEIINVEDLNENYQIGAAYFLKLKTLSFEKLWTDYLQPLLYEYIQGMYNEDEIMNRFAKAYGYSNTSLGDSNEHDENQR